MNDTDLNGMITAYEHALHDHQSAVALQHLNGIARSVYELIQNESSLQGDGFNQEPARSVVPMLVAWTERTKECCSPDGEPFPSQDPAQVVQRYRAAWNHPPFQPDDDRIFAELINCLGRPVAGITGSSELLRQFADPSGTNGQAISHIVRLINLWSHVWQRGLEYVQRNWPDALDHALLP